MELKGLAAAPGIAVGPCLVLEEVHHPDYTQCMVEPALVEEERQRLLYALRLAEAQLAGIRDRAEAAGRTEQAAVMDAHLMILGDPALSEGFLETITVESLCAAGAVQKGIAAHAAVFEALDDPYLRERAQDIRDIGQRILGGVLGVTALDISRLEGPTVLIAHDIAPSLMAAADRENLIGIVAEIGGKTSHTAILANNMGIPAVLGCKGAVAEAARLKPGDMAAIDGAKGLVRLGVGPEELAALESARNRQQALSHSLQALSASATLTADGVSIQLGTNVMGPQDLAAALSVGAEGVGLYRTEFLFMDRPQAPEEEEQVQAYRAIVEGLEGKPVIIRTLDIGGDKAVDYLDIGQEENPFLGYRALRICLDRPELFQTQLRAILRTGVYGNVMIMFPMVCSLEELRAAKAHVEAAKDQLRTRGIPYAADVPVGIMIEIPSAAVLADVLIEECDFFSIGSNDLTQYTLAVDRMNARISPLYNSFHPAMLRLIKTVADAAHQGGGNKFAGMCGEMAGDPRATLLLAGLGLRELSMSPGKLLRVRKLIGGMTLAYAEEVAKKALRLSTAAEIEALLHDALPEELQAYLC